MNGKELIFGLPRGEPLNSPGTGNTESLLRRAKYDIRGYTPGSETEPGIENDSEIACSLLEPPEFYTQTGELPDIFIERGPLADSYGKVEPVEPMVPDLGYRFVETPAGLWISEHTKSDAWKTEKALIVRDLLKAAACGTTSEKIDGYCSVEANVAKECSKAVLNALYFGREGIGFFGKGPTLSPIFDVSGEPSDTYAAIKVTIPAILWPGLFSVLRRIKTEHGEYAVTHIMYEDIQLFIE